jgi:RHS repeat-associated protein
LTYPDQMQLAYEYDPATQALDRIREPASGQVWLADVETGKFGKASSIVLGNGVARTVQFDFTGRAHRLLTVADAATLSDLHYAYDANSNITRIQETAGPSPRGDMYYSYDTLDRLAKAWGTTMSGQPAGTELSPLFRYGYDPLGRMTHNSRFLNATYAGYTLEYEYSANPDSDRPAHAVRGIRFVKAATPTVYAHLFSYDRAGNLVRSTNEAGAVARNDLERTYVWDALGRLQSLTNGAGTTRFYYDHGNTRVRKTDPTGQSAIYIGNIMELTVAGVTKHIFAGSQRLATIKSDGQKLFYMTDHLRSTTLVTDEAASVVQRMDYEPYGALIENARSGNPAALRHTYTGQESDGETGLMYYGARYYDPVVGMFVSADRLTRQRHGLQMFTFPDLLISAQTAPQRFNRFAYCGNNPMVYVDSSGEDFGISLLIAVIVGAVLGAVGSAISGAVEGKTGWDLGRDILIGFGIGAACGALGAGVGAGASAAAVALGAVKGGVLASVVGGAAGGAIAGFAGGFFTEASQSAAAGETVNWERAAALGGIEGAIGLVAGGAGGAMGSKLASRGASRAASRAAPRSGLFRAARLSPVYAAQRFTSRFGAMFEESFTALFEVVLNAPVMPAIPSQDEDWP